jgi:hypothetical protein
MGFTFLEARTLEAGHRFTLHSMGQPEMYAVECKTRPDSICLHPKWGSRQTDECDHLFTTCVWCGAAATFAATSPNLEHP